MCKICMLHEKCWWHSLSGLAKLLWPDLVLRLQMEKLHHTNQLKAECTQSSRPESSNCEILLLLNDAWWNDWRHHYVEHSPVGSVMLTLQYFKFMGSEWGPWEHVGERSAVDVVVLCSNLISLHGYHSWLNIKINCSMSKQHVWEAPSRDFSWCCLGRVRHW